MFMMHMPEDFKIGDSAEAVTLQTSGSGPQATAGTAPVARNSAAIPVRRAFSF
jgi:hypothetical protein